MPVRYVELPPRFLRTPEAARFLNISPRTLEKHRSYGTGPTYRKLGGRVIYAIGDLQAWADLGVHASTADYDRVPAPVPPVVRRAGRA